MFICRKATPKNKTENGQVFAQLRLLILVARAYDTWVRKGLPLEVLPHTLRQLRQNLSQKQKTQFMDAAINSL